MCIEVMKPPFEVTEVGWGEFEAGIRLHFKDASEAPVDFLHTIKLYHPLDDATSASLKKVICDHILILMYISFYRAS